MKRHSVQRDRHVALREVTLLGALYGCVHKRTFGLDIVIRGVYVLISRGQDRMQDTCCLDLYQ